MKDNGNQIDSIKRFEDDKILKEVKMLNQNVDELVDAFELEIDSDDSIPQEDDFDDEQTIEEPHCKYTPTINQFCQIWDTMAL